MNSIILSLPLVVITSPFITGYTAEELRCEVCKAVVSEVENVIEKINSIKKSAKTNVGSYRLDEKGNMHSKMVPLIQSDLFLLETLDSACERMDNYARGYDKKTRKLRVVKMKTGESLSDEMSEIDAISDIDLNESIKYNCEDIADEYESDFLRVFKEKENDHMGELWMTSGVFGGNETGLEIECSQRYLNFCLSLLPKMVDQTVLKRMPVSEMEIDSLCRGFSTEMECFNRYARKCLIPRERNLIEVHSSGAKNIYKYLCSDSSFRSEYLKHTKCFKGTQSDWESCVSRFVQLFKDEIESQNTTHETRILHTCCAIHGFSRCVFVPGTLKCERDDALFLLKLTEISIDRQEYYRDCRTITNYTICIGCASQISCLLLTTSYFILKISN